ncbi:phosphotransferase [Paracidovorax citrulli]|nr:phosphotransferase [Paracidovorax citrulli]UMT94966.1 phosphotransferase [Paracidovorax citrulli]
MHEKGQLFREKHAPLTALEVGRRHGEPVVLRIAAQRLHAGGHMFHQVENGVWLTSSVPPGFPSLAHD